MIRKRIMSYVSRANIYLKNNNNGFQRLDHLRIGQLLTIWVPNTSFIQIPTGDCWFSRVKLKTFWEVKWASLARSFYEASSHDQIKMTKFGLDYDQKIFTPTNLNFGTWLKVYAD